MTEKEIIYKCKLYNIRTYSINPDMSIDVDGPVWITGKQLQQLPLKFNKVDGIFNCSRNGLTTLVGCPNYIGGNFYCSDNKITSLQELPMNFYVGGNVKFVDNRIVEAKEFGRLLFGYIDGKVYTGHGNLSQFFDENKNPPKKDLPRLLSELRKIKLY